jgi:hypothetical protein
VLSPHSNLRPELLVGPLLRYAGTEHATVWVETNTRCEVDILGHTAPTFAVDGHHYALVVLDDLEPGCDTPYEVRLDGAVVWPTDDERPRPFIRTREWERRLRLAFGSCRLGAPQPTSVTSPWSAEVERTGIDALWAYSKALQRGEVEHPDALLLLGDQVYADEVSPATAAFIKARRDTTRPPYEEIANFEEYTQLYRESWSDPDIRWLLSTVPSVMIFDDHDVRDDWNISWRWLEEIRNEDWWDDRITGAFMSYWLYQHLGNLSPPELEQDEVFRFVQQEQDAGTRLREHARKCDRESAACRWAYHRDFGDTRLLVLDSRAARVLADQRREMIDPEEWAWVVDHSRGAFDHLVIASTLPVYMAHGIHHLQTWNEAVCAGRWGKLAARLGERLRRKVDLEHWCSFNESFERLGQWLGSVAEGTDDVEPPASIVLLGGDVHHAYVAEVTLGDRPRRSRVFQIVCSPFRNPLTRRERRILRVTGSRAAAVLFAFLARLAGVPPTADQWEFVREPTFHNSIGELELHRRSARITIRRSAREGELADGLYLLHETMLANHQTTTHASILNPKGELDASHA